jgi:hypothetical protein
MLEVPGTDWTYFGKHHHRFEPPDIYYCVLDGDVSADDMKAQIFGLQSLSEKAQRPIFWLSDVSKMGNLTLEARRAAGLASSTEVRAALLGCGVFGAAFGTRVMVGLLVRAARALNPNRVRPLALVATEAEARAFLEECRRNKARPIVGI